MKRSHVRSEELLALLCDGEALPLAEKQHLDCCPLCQDLMLSYQQISAQLISQLYRSSCPSATTLSAYCLPGALSNDEQRRVAAHLACCPCCTSELAETRQFLEISL
jgi:hypothetical protein